MVVLPSLTDAVQWYSDWLYHWKSEGVYQSEEHDCVVIHKDEPITISSILIFIVLTLFAIALLGFMWNFTVNTTISIGQIIGAL